MQTPFFEKDQVTKKALPIKCESASSIAILFFSITFCESGVNKNIRKSNVDIRKSNDLSLKKDLIIQEEIFGIFQEDLRSGRKFLKGGVC